MFSAQPLILRNPGHQSHDSRSPGNAAQVFVEHGRKANANSMRVAPDMTAFERDSSEREVRSDVQQP
jgi:hypothetical protein